MVDRWGTFLPIKPTAGVKINNTGKQNTTTLRYTNTWQTSVMKRAVCNKKHQTNMRERKREKERERERGRERERVKQKHTYVTVVLNNGCVTRVSSCRC